jgi:hypothetical protein
METTETIARQLVAASDGAWAAEPAASENVVLRPAEWNDRRFAPNITVLVVPGPPALHVPSTAVQLAASLDERPPVALHQLVVDDYDGVAVTHETVWLDGDDGTYVAVTASACGGDIADVARLMKDWQTQLRRDGDE